MVVPVANFAQVYAAVRVQPVFGTSMPLI